MQDRHLLGEIRPYSSPQAIPSLKHGFYFFWNNSKPQLIQKSFPATFFWYLRTISNCFEITVNRVEAMGYGQCRYLIMTWCSMKEKCFLLWKNLPIELISEKIFCESKNNEATTLPVVACICGWFGGMTESDEYCREQ